MPFLRPSVTPLLSLLLLSSCAYQAQQIRLVPNIPALNTPMRIAPMGHEVIIRTRDARLEKVIGMRNAGYRDQAPITAENEVGSLLKEKSVEILNAWDYRATGETPGVTRSLLVELQELSYQAVTENGERKVKIRALLTAVAQNGKDSLKKTYDSTQERQVVVEPIAKSNDEWINETFSKALSEFAADARLKDFLK